jgi:hypothetical protein
MLSNQMQLASFPADMLAAVKETVNPCEDFYEFACGTWNDEHKDKIDKVDAPNKFIQSKVVCDNLQFYNFDLTCCFQTVQDEHCYGMDQSIR